MYYLAREIEKAQARHRPIQIELPALEPLEGQHDGYKKQVVEIAPPQLWADEISVSAQVNPVQAARRLLGDAEYEHWKYAGGTAGILFEIIRAAAGASSLGESSES